MNIKTLSALFATALVLSNTVSAADQVRIYNWAEYIGATTLKDFQAKTGMSEPSLHNVKAGIFAISSARKRARGSRALNILSGGDDSRVGERSLPAGSG